MVQSLDTGTRTTLVEGGSDARYLPSGFGSPAGDEPETGHLIYAVSGVLFARPFDLGRLAVTGNAVSVIEGVRRGAGAVGTGTAHFSVSDTGTLAYLPGPIASSSIPNLQLAFADRSGALDVLEIPPGPYSVPRMSPDGRAIAFGRDDGRDVSIWLYDLSGAVLACRLTFGGQDRYPAWTADSHRVVFQSDREGDLALFWQRIDGTGTAERLTKPRRTWRTSRSRRRRTARCCWSIVLPMGRRRFSFCQSRTGPSRPLAVLIVHADRRGLFAGWSVGRPPRVRP